MRTYLPLIAASWLIASCPAPARAQNAIPSKLRTEAKRLDGVFLVKPYLQLGHAPVKGMLLLLWHADDADADWSVEYRPGADRPWRKAEAPSVRRVAVAGIGPHRVYRAALTGLVPGGEFAYRVSKGGEVVFSAEGRASKAADQPYRFVAFGDCAAGTPQQKAIAYRAYLAHPDFVMIPGDIVYSRGRISEYRDKFWAVYNADEASPTVGVPFLRSTLFLAAPGNHDIATRDLERYPDGLAYFLYWDQPLNGPLGKEGSAHVPALTGSVANKKAFAEAAGEAYPRMANFSFDYGNAHWTVIDANPYVDWSDRDIRAWVERDLAEARGATWRFVAFHHPGFNSSRQHFEQQQMRRMAKVLEVGKVDIVFSGHVHNYQRSYPLRFVTDNGGGTTTHDSMVGGRWTLDKSFDGRSNTRPAGVIYLVTGGGGAKLYNPEQQDDPGSWQEFTDKFSSKVHSLTVADVNGPTLTVRQLSVDGAEIDRFIVTK
jgi:3',5'-cyclic AMP phosphodiesterase CpdA